ncbi:MULTISPECIES: hypothetical protein [Nosocomiicoccus]|uniref:Uncharacterized protein n=1 Tax=Nosocomiicoccus massiliensis TaxID=1232430 RepID=A0AAF0YKB0_9STAP|nr:MULTISPECIES: hypothetical protein [Nosocomiicoccus]MDK6863576.1 hypothetical protein [Nosocomiicoccus ampullae]OFO53633.1 hypothetical protein HMPREF3029_05595 [Nosocomiicoccus sp. HMSC059G07]OFS62008.1 hypothetical protein HMPREF3177_06855 [Nosocomiicoccus sp. HMSC09A07]WOS95907.1 hypothetical protein CJ229_007415 [Nosocomiicoccus massiliensis]
MFKYDKDTKPYHIKNFIFYIFAFIVLGAIYYFAFLPPLLDATSGEFFNEFGFRQFVGSIFFLILFVLPFALIYGAFYHFKGFTDKNVRAHQK